MFRGISPEEYSQYIAVLTEAQAIELTGQEYTDYSYFNPIILNSEWAITIEEIVNCTNEQFMWVKDLPLIPYFPAE
jgi:hypothetical protein